MRGSASSWEATPAVLAVAFVAAVAIDRLQHFLTKRRVPVFYQQVAGGAVATVLAAVATRAAESVVTMDASLVVSANIIMLLAGIGFMGAIQDAMSGFYVTGGARLLEAVLATAGIIAGVSGGISLATAVGLDLPTLEPARTDLAGVSVAALGAAIAAAGFGFSSYAPLRTLVPVGLLAGGALAITEAVSGQDFARAWAVGVAAFVVGLVSYTVAGRLRVPPLVVVVPAVVPLLPGLTIYRGLSLLGAQADPAPAPGPARDGHRRLGGDRARCRRDPGGVRRPAGQAGGPPGRDPARRAPPGRRHPLPQAAPGPGVS